MKETKLIKMQKDIRDLQQFKMFTDIWNKEFQAHILDLHNKVKELQEKINNVKPEK